jgi:bifunctional DNA-binding transcriptional regulator/antitoxin component of YhaV-PrlF toxin-antitoxin module
VPRVAESGDSPTQHTAGQHIPQDPSIPRMAVPDLLQRHYVPPSHYAVAAVDGHGRIAATFPLRILGWRPGTEVAFTVDDNRLITAACSAALTPQQSTAPRRVITPGGHLNLPIVTRRRAGMSSSDRVLLAADERTGLLWICPPKTLALILQPYMTQQKVQP